MAKEETLVLSNKEYWEFHEALDKTRASSTTVAVPKEALRKLLEDHGVLYSRVEIQLKDESLVLKTPDGELK